MGAAAVAGLAGGDGDRNCVCTIVTTAMITTAATAAAICFVVTPPSLIKAIKPRPCCLSPVAAR
jgi:hypothetical protein